ncbi:MAG: DUF3298 domain-containing protein [Rhizobiales bacterium]|nr:DUF3298 domain-containing protein [Hyphomicrobiales bacterium]
MRLVIAALVPFVLAAGPALAEVPVKTVKIDRKSDTVDIELAYPETGVAAIDGPLTAWVTGMAADFQESADKDFAAFKDDNDGELPPWSYSLYLGFEVARNDDRMLVFDYDQSTFLGGAHPNHEVITANYMMPDGWQVYLPEIFDGDRALRKISALAIADLNRQLLGPDSMSDEGWIATGAGPSWSNFQDFLLLADKLVIRFPPYQVAAYAAGDQRVEIPLATLEGVMRKDWRTPVASFDCAKAGSPTEKAICSDIALARLDRGLADSYTVALSFTDDAGKAQIREAQRQWIAARNACGGDVACLTSEYEARIKVLQTPPA